MDSATNIAFMHNAMNAIQFSIVVRIRYMTTVHSINHFKSYVRKLLKAFQSRVSKTFLKPIYTDVHISSCNFKQEFLSSINSVLIYWHLVETEPHRRVSCPSKINLPPQHNICSAQLKKTTEDDDDAQSGKC